MNRRSDLEQHIKESYSLVSEFEQSIRTSSEPEAVLRWKRKRDDQWKLIHGYLEEYARLLRGGRMPIDILEIATHFPEFYYGDSPVERLASDVRSWLGALGYSISDEVHRGADLVDLLVDVRIEIALLGKVTQQVQVRCVGGEAQLSHIQTLVRDLNRAEVGRGQIIASRRVSSAAREYAKTSDEVEVMTFDELIDSTARFDKYFDWLKNEVKARGIDVYYIDLACRKAEVDPATGQELGISHYAEKEGWIDGYVDRWVDDPAKEHLSVLGEFGAGKTWFSLHYACRALETYEKAKRVGTERPRIPILISLREFSHVGDIEALFSKFFFKKYEISVPSYRAFDQLNHMGKLLLMFDGFDEMAQRVDYNKVVNQFWELARTVVPGAKVLLTCRTEHFRYAREASEVLGGEVDAGQRKIVLTPPRFEVLELEPLDNQQIRKILSLHTDEATTARVLAEPRLADLARRPILIELILEALPRLGPGIPLSVANIYLHAVNRKMERDILEERTFTSMEDKVFFMTELAWEMFSTGSHKIHYREIPDRIGRYFNVDGRSELDAYDYDLRTQTLLTRDEEGLYEFAHKSLMEFFIGLKLVNEIRQRKFEALRHEIQSREIFAFARQLVSPMELCSVLEFLPTEESSMLHFNVYHILGGLSVNDFAGLDIESLILRLLDKEHDPYPKYRLLYWAIMNFDNQEFVDESLRILEDHRDEMAKYVTSTWIRYYGGTKELLEVLKARVFHPRYSRLTPVVYLLVFESVGNQEIADWLEEHVLEFEEKYRPRVKHTISVIRRRFR